MATNEQIQQTVAEALQVAPAELLPATNLYALPGFDSVQLLTLMVVLEEIGVVLQPADAANLRTFGDVLALSRR